MLRLNLESVTARPRDRCETRDHFKIQCLSMHDTAGSATMVLSSDSSHYRPDHDTTSELCLLAEPSPVSTTPPTRRRVTDCDAMQCPAPPAPSISELAERVVEDHEKTE